MYKRTIGIITGTLLCLPAWVAAQQAVELQQFKPAEAKQGVAVDAAHFYVINNSTITKHEKSGGQQVASWDGTKDSVKHLNSGIVIKGKLYCANSNYPQSPMAGSIEIFDAATLKHERSHSFGIGYGSVTWIDQRDGHWWVVFANYTGRGSSEGRDNRWTTLVKFTMEWQMVESWIFPPQVIERFGTRTCSGGVWGEDGLLYITGHDHPELYVLKLPPIGYTLEYIKTIPVPVYGQGIALDKSVRNRMIFYGLSREDNTVIKFELKK